VVYLANIIIFYLFDLPTYAEEVYKKIIWKLIFALVTLLITISGYKITKSDPEDPVIIE